MPRAVVVLGFVCWPMAAVIAQQTCVTIPAGEFRLVPSTFLATDPPLHSGQLPRFELLTWTGSHFDGNLYDSQGGGWGWDPPPLFFAAWSAVGLHPMDGPLTVCFPEPSRSPNLPLLLACGFNLVCCQSNAVATFEELVGRPPWAGVQVYRFNGGPGRSLAHFAPPDYAIYTFSAGAWSPTAPRADVAEGVFVYQPAPRLWDVHFADGQPHFDVTAPPGMTVAVEYAEGCGSGGQPPAWKELATFMGTGNFQPVTDATGSGATSQRFYRARVAQGQ